MATKTKKRKVYRPSEDEPFMNKKQREYFRKKLEAWRDEIVRESRETLAHLPKWRGTLARIWRIVHRRKQNAALS